ncbi:MAG: pyrroline-5-carboxylate reductase [Candidatus Puniceispirillales bacterium]
MKICLVGCGKMGSSLLEGWSLLSLIHEILIIEPNSDNIPKELIRIKKFYFYNDLTKIENSNVFDIIVLAVKPQVMKDVVTQLSKLNIKSNAWLSIAAGLSVNFFENYLGHNQAIIRTIPNTPSSVLKGITAMYFNTNCNSQIIENAEMLMNAVGETIKVNDEELMDAYTAISGSGPAYIYYMVEAMIDAGIQIGIDPKNAKILAEKTLVGSAYLLENKNVDAQELRKAVTSPKGTTEAGLEILMKDNNFFNLVKNAINEAKNRGKDLGKAIVLNLFNV